MLQSCVVFLSVNSYWLIFPRHTPNVYLIPYGNYNYQNKSIHDLLLSVTQSLEQSGHPLMCSHSPSKFPSIPYPVVINPLERIPRIRRSTTKAYTYLITIIPFTTCSWKSMDTISTSVLQWPFS